MIHNPSLFELAGIPLPFAPLAATGLVLILAALLALLVRLAYRRHDGVLPRGGLSLIAALEYLLESLSGFIHSILGKHTADFERFLIGIFFFILLSNLLGLIPGLLAPTTDFAINLAMAVTVFIYYHYVGIRHHGLHYLKVFLGPVWWLAFLMLPIEVVSHFARILSLSMRLTGNMTGEHAVMGMFAAMLPIGPTAIFLFLGLLTAVLQAFVFMTLSTIYILLSIEIEH